MVVYYLIFLGIIEDASPFAVTYVVFFCLVGMKFVFVVLVLSF
jgi:hypothetical protein